MVTIVFNLMIFECIFQYCGSFSPLVKKKHIKIKPGLPSSLVEMANGDSDLASSSVAPAI
jgi:hypothetical protein